MRRSRRHLSFVSFPTRRASGKRVAGSSAIVCRAEELALLAKELALLAKELALLAKELALLAKELALLAKELNEIRKKVTQRLALAILQAYVKMNTMSVRPAQSNAGATFFKLGRVEDDIWECRIMVSVGCGMMKGIH